MGHQREPQLQDHYLQAFLLKQVRVTVSQYCPVIHPEVLMVGGERDGTTFGIVDVASGNRDTEEESVLLC